MRIPKKEEVMEVIKAVLRTHLRVRAQRRLRRLVLEALQRKGERVKLSPIRVRRLAAELPEVKIKVKTKPGKATHCPLCSSELEPVEGVNVFGNPLLAGYRCKHCKFETCYKSFTPTRYLFYWKG